jgi:hypothetical protein
LSLFEIRRTTLRRTFRLIFDRENLRFARQEAAAAIAAQNPGNAIARGGHFEDVASFDAFSGAPTGGTERVWVSDKQMGYVEQMANALTVVNTFGANAAAGAIQGTYATAVDVARGWGMLLNGAAYGTAEKFGLIDEGTTDRA